MAEHDCVRCPHWLEEHRVPIDPYGGYEYGSCRLCDCERIVWTNSLEAVLLASGEAARDLAKELARPFRALAEKLLGRMHG